jgi:hypothetical protein
MERAWVTEELTPPLPRWPGGGRPVPYHRRPRPTRTGPMLLLVGVRQNRKPKSLVCPTLRRTLGLETLAASPRRLAGWIGVRL